MLCMTWKHLIVFEKDGSEFTCLNIKVTNNGSVFTKTGKLSLMRQRENNWFDLS